MNTIKQAFKLPLLFILLLLAGCASYTMTNDASVSTQPAAGQAKIVFMCPNYFGAFRPVALYNISNKTTQLIGVITSGHKFAYSTGPGKHVFMLKVGQKVDFLRADLGKDKLYYVLIGRVAGVMNEEYVFAAFKPKQYGDFSFRSSFFRGTRGFTSFQVPTARLQTWGAEHQADAVAARKTYATAWKILSKTAQAQKTLTPNDNWSKAAEMPLPPKK